MSAEKQLRALESDIKSLKASYPIAGSKVKFYVQTSQEFTVSGQEVVRIKFTPTYGLNRTSFTKLRASISIDGSPAGYSPQVNEPQDGSGSTVIRVQFSPYSSATNYSLRIIASGTSTGSFAML